MLDEIWESNQNGHFFEKVEWNFRQDESAGKFLKVPTYRAKASLTLSTSFKIFQGWLKFLKISPDLWDR